MTRILTVFASLCWLISVNVAAAVDNSKAAEMIKQAEDLTQQADSLGFQWRDTAQLITDAKSALETGDAATAEQLAQQAAMQSQAAIQQAKDQSKVGPHF